MGELDGEVWFWAVVTSRQVAGVGQAAKVLVRIVVLVMTSQSVLTVHHSCHVRVATQQVGPFTSLTEWNALRLAFLLACGTAVESKPTSLPLPRLRHFMRSK